MNFLLKWELVFPLESSQIFRWREANRKATISHSSRFTFDLRDGFKGTGTIQHPHLSKKAGATPGPFTTCARHMQLQITGNYISQAPLPPGFLAGSANGRHGLKTEGKEEEAARIFLTPPTCPTFPAATATPWLWSHLEVLHLGSGNTSSSFGPFPQGIVVTSYNW